MTPEIANIFAGDLAEAVARRRDDSGLAVARQRDLAAYEQAQLRGFITGTLFQSDDAERFASLNAGVATPGTLQHYGAPAPSKSPA